MPTWGVAPSAPSNSSVFKYSGLMKKSTAVICAADMVLSLALLEPYLGRLEKLGDALTSKQYLLIMPTGEVAQLVPAAREIRVALLGKAGAAMMLAGLIPAAARLRQNGLDRWSAGGSSLVLAGLGMMAGEYASGGEWVLAGRIGARYLASAMIAVGSFLCLRNRAYLSTLGIGGFTWDLSSAIFWAWHSRSLKATVPVPWYHHFDQEEGRGAPCWLVMLMDLSAIAYFGWVSRTDYDPLRAFVE